MIESIDRVVNAIGGFLYRPYIVPLFLLAAGLYFTCLLYTSDAADEENLV